MLDSYHNRYPGQLATELDAARRVGFAPVEVPGPRFGTLAAEGQAMIYVLVGNRLLVSERQVMGERITHAALADGRPVQAAGEFEVDYQEGIREVTALNNLSGHYRPSGDSLEVARAAFEARGLRVRPSAVRRYDLEAP